MEARHSMILKRLVLHGFKSFADKTDFDFEPGITGIVGPNGCGKSNVVDAIKWVLGSQSAKSLRGTQMLDVIFNGSGTRKPSGMAQVDLIFDNSDRRLPIDQTEVTVSRRLFRSGESEYLLNKQVCRLKDIKELFLDTGIGVEAYSVIEQGRVDGLLRANPVDRRAIFEEAAGISKYKVRRIEAQRRLERVNQNLARAGDIIEELERRLRSIKIQATKARNYQEYSSRLRELRSTHALVDYHRLHDARSVLERSAASFSDRATAHRTEIDSLEASASQVGAELLELEEQITALDGRLLSVQADIAAQQERMNASEQRIGEQVELLERCRARLAAIDQQTAGLAEQHRQQAAAAADVEQRAAEAARALTDLQATEGELSAEFGRRSAELESEKSGVLELVRRTSQLNNELSQIGLMRENLLGQRSRLEARDAQIATQLAELMHRRRQAESRRDELERLIAEQTAQLEAARTAVSDATRDRAQVAEQLAAAKERRSAIQSRHDVLAELDARREGLLAGSREVLERRDADTSGATFAYVLGPVGELFEADAADAHVVEAALGEFSQYLVVRSRDALLNDSAAVAGIAGRVLAFALDALPPTLAMADLREQPGVVTLLADRVRCPEDCRHLLRQLLGRTYLVESIDDARQLAAAFPDAGRYVTPDGAIVEADGRVALGPLDRTAGLISRRSELRELSATLETAGREIAALTEHLATAEQAVVEWQRRQQETQDALVAASAQRAEAAALLAAHDDETLKLSAEQPQIAAEAGELARLMLDAARREEQSQLSLVEARQQAGDRERRVAELSAALEQLSDRRRAMAEQITEARVRAGELSQRRQSLADAQLALEASQRGLAEERDAAERDVANANTRIEQSQRAIVESRAALETLENERRRISTEAQARRQRRDDLRHESEERNDRVRGLRQELEETERRLHAEELELGQVKVRIDDLVARVRDELHIDLVERYAGAPPTEHDLAAVAAEIDELRGKIDRLGNVNLDAISEQEELEQRYAFLTKQRDDLRASEKQLTELIEKLNVESTARFGRTFEEVRGHFSALFKKLFGGGKADVFLENPSDPLESGIEIMVRPPGKELQSMTLLSGGEKTMTAIALLLAVFRTRPSPFAILDEVDAALDEANNQRFNHVVQEFVSGTQFLVITHSKRTMSMVDVLYGITMQEAGVSKRISVKFERESERNDDRAQSAVA